MTGMLRRFFLGAAIVVSLPMAHAFAQQASSTNENFDGVWVGELRTHSRVLPLQLKISDSVSGNAKVEQKSTAGDGAFTGKVAGNELTYQANRGTSYITKKNSDLLEFTYVTNN